MHWMHLPIRRSAHRNDVQLKAGALQPQQLLCNECFRQSGIALYDHDDLSVVHGHLLLHRRISWKGAGHIIDVIAHCIADCLQTIKIDAPLQR